MARTLSAGIDIGTHQVKVVVAEKVSEAGRSLPRIIGSGFAETRGVRHGYIVNLAETTKSVDQAVRKAERSSEIKIKSAYVSAGGIGLSGITVSGSTVISRADLEITALDMEKAIEASKAAIPEQYALNRQIIHRIPIQYKVDGKLAFDSQPLGLKGNKLEVKTLFVTCIEPHLNDLVTAVEDNGIEVTDIVAAPIAASLVTLSKQQKIAGVVLANIGAETVSIIVFENGTPISLEVFPIGATDITNDIALGLKIPLNEAEEIKQGGIIGLSYSKKKLDDIITARLSDIFDLVENHLKKIGRNGLLPAGIVITGGGSKIATVEDLARASLNLPSRVASLNFGGNIKDLGDSVWAVAYGLCLIGLSEEVNIIGASPENKNRTKNKFFSWFKQLLP